MIKQPSVEKHKNNQWRKTNLPLEFRNQAYVVASDGSFVNGRWGAGYVIAHYHQAHYDIITQQGWSGKDTRFNARNITGEIIAVVSALKTCQNLLNNSDAPIFLLYDYKGLYEWWEGNWKTSNALTRKYKRFAEDNKHKLPNLIFQKVSSKDKNPFHRIAHKLAYEAASAGL